MEKKNESNSYLNMIWGTFGILLVVVGMVKYISLYTSMTNILLIWLGFLIMLHYIYSLERKAGISNKLIWLRAAVLILTFIISAVIFY